MVLIKSVQIDLNVKGDAESKAKLEAIDKKQADLRKAFGPDYALKIDSAAASERLKVFRADMAATAARVTKPMDPVILTGKATKKLAEIGARAEELKRKFPEFTVRINDAEAKRKLALFAAESKATTDLIDSRLGSAGGGGRGGGLLSGLLGGGGAAGQAGGGLGALGPYGIGGLAALAAALGPGLIGLGIGGGVGAAGVGGSLMAAKYLQQQVTAAQQSVKSAQSAQLGQASLANTIAGLQQRITAASRGTAAQRATVPGLQRTLGIDQARFAQGGAAAAGLPGAQAQLAQEKALLAPFTALTTSLTRLGDTALMTFAKSVAPILKPVAGIFADIGRQVRLLGPVMSQMFRASLPFIRMFADLMLQSGKILMPAFTQAMNQMVKSGALPLMAQGLTTLVKGVAGFITALGPGMKSSAMLFNDTAVIIAKAMRGAGLAVSWLSNAVEWYVHKARLNMHEWASSFDDFRHRTAVIFDGVRHDIAHVWDQVFSNSIGSVIRIGHNVETQFSSLRHGIAVIFDGTRRNIADAWNLIWANTISRVANGVGIVVNWFRGLPGKILGSLGNAGRTLAGWGGGVIRGLLSGMTGVIGSVWNFIKGIPGKILSFLGIHSPPQWAIDAGKHIMNGIGIGMAQAQGAAKKGTALFRASAAAAAQRAAQNALGGGSGPVGADAAAAQNYARSRLGAYGWSVEQMLPLIALWNQESGWSRFAYNASSGATGIPQALPYSKMPRAAWLPSQGGHASAGAQIDWGLAYIAGRYGSPAGAWGHEVGFNWYGSGTSSAAPGWAWVGERGPELVKFRGGEQVAPAHAGAGGGRGGDTYITLNVTAPVGSSPREIGRQVAEVLGAHIKGGGRIYPAGVTPR